jgi:hypothetical protein
VVAVFAGWIGEICDRHVPFDAKPNPVVVKDGVYWFPLGGRLFAVPEKYGWNSTDGSARRESRQFIHAEDFFSVPCATER